MNPRRPAFRLDLRAAEETRSGPCRGVARLRQTGESGRTRRAQKSRPGAAASRLQTQRATGRVPRVCDWPGLAGWVVVVQADPRKVGRQGADRGQRTGRVVARVV